MTNNAKIPPVIKWSGSKRNIAASIGEMIPEAKCYYEPFVGGGALLAFRRIKNGIAGDIIPELINLWKSIKINPKSVANEYRYRWNLLQDQGPKTFYDIRDNFNKTRNVNDFLFLTRTCVNGLIRYNSQNDFNNSFHLSRPGINPDTLENIIFTWHNIISDVTFYNCDYKEILSSVNKNDFVFLDPPYGGTKGRYTKSYFLISDFLDQLERLNSIGAKWILTFDGSAGNRKYNYFLPKELYKVKYLLSTGNSPFTKMMKTSIDSVKESVYLNFNPITEPFAETTYHRQEEATLFNYANV
jgi:DNA adenine methylase